MHMYIWACLFSSIYLCFRIANSLGQNKGIDAANSIYPIPIPWI